MNSTGNSKEIREAKEADFPALQRIYTAAQAESFHWLSAAAVAELDIRADSRGEKIWVAAIEGEVVGFISVWEPDNFIHHLFVHPRHTRKNIGTQLIGHAVTQIGRPALLKCVSQNQPALDFYKARGWLTTRTGRDGEVEYEEMELR